jgi:hypothetical protein
MGSILCAKKALGFAGNGASGKMKGNPPSYKVKTIGVC